MRKKEVSIQQIQQTKLHDKSDEAELLSKWARQKVTDNIVAQNVEQATDSAPSYNVFLNLQQSVIDMVGGDFGEEEKISMIRGWLNKMISMVGVLMQNPTNISLLASNIPTFFNQFLEVCQQNASQPIFEACARQLQQLEDSISLIAPLKSNEGVVEAFDNVESNHKIKQEEVDDILRTIKKAQLSHEEMNEFEKKLQIERADIYKMMQERHEEARRRQKSVILPIVKSETKQHEKPETVQVNTLAQKISVSSKVVNVIKSILHLIGLEQKGEITATEMNEHIEDSCKKLNQQELDAVILATQSHGIKQEDDGLNSANLTVIQNFDRIMDSGNSDTVVCKASKVLLIDNKGIDDLSLHQLGIVKKQIEGKHPSKDGRNAKDAIIGLLDDKIKDHKIKQINSVTPQVAQARPPQVAQARPPQVTQARAPQGEEEEEEDDDQNRTIYDDFQDIMHADGKVKASEIIGQVYKLLVDDQGIDQISSLDELQNIHEFTHSVVPQKAQGIAEKTAILDALSHRAEDLKKQYKTPSKSLFQSIGKILHNIEGPTPEDDDVSPQDDDASPEDDDASPQATPANRPTRPAIISTAQKLNDRLNNEIKTIVESTTVGIGNSVSQKITDLNDLLQRYPNFVPRKDAKLSNIIGKWKPRSSNILSQNKKKLVTLLK